MKLKNKKQLVPILQKHTNKFFYDEIVKNGVNVPKGLENKINIYWFLYFFTYPEGVKHFGFQEYEVDIKNEDGEEINFSGDWLDVPFPYANKIRIDSLERELTDDFYNWFELVQYMNDLLIEEGRLVDLGITGMSYKDKEIEFWYST
jgi:hypothetical protein